jgi:hypothetical protein
MQLFSPLQGNQHSEGNVTPTFGTDLLVSYLDYSSIL